MEELDPNPWLWAADGEHPPLWEASRAPITSKAWTCRREHDRSSRHASGKAEGRFKDIDMWPIIIRENIQPGADSGERLMAYAKRCGGPMMLEFCFHNWDKLQSIVERSWKVEKVEEFIDFHAKSRMQILQDAMAEACTCNGQWAAYAQKILAMNNIPESSWCQAMVASLANGRAKGNLVCHAGLHGNEGKSFLFRPLLKVFGPDNVFVAPPPKSSFPLTNLEKARCAWLDDWRFNEDTVPYSVQLLWFEGAPFVIARPQNQFSGHLRYSKDDPVFITTLLADLTALKGKRFLQQGDLDMMLKRLVVFQFAKQISIPKAVVEGCASCFAKFILQTQAPVHAPLDPAPADLNRRKLQLQDAETWSVQDVVTFLGELALGHLAPVFEDNGVDGQMLCELSLDDLTSSLGLKPLQARKLMNRLWPESS